MSTASATSRNADQRPADSSHDPLLLRRCAAPEPARSLVQRNRLFEALTRATEGPLTLVSALAGSGKTLLVASWVSTGLPPGPVAWLTLDADDNSPDRFWHSVRESLAYAGIVFPEDDEPEDLITTFPALLAAALVDRPGALVLVLDEFDAIDDPDVLAGVDRLLHRSGPWLRVVLVSRLDPALPLARYRLRGELAEIRARDLAFSPGEAADLLALDGVTLPAAATSALCARVSGWAAGLRLSALSLQLVETVADQERFIAELVSSEATLADYLVGEVLGGQTPARRTFLLQTSILDEVSPELADVLTGRSDSARVLRGLARDLPFVSAVASSGRWYRYHRLFAEVLRAQLSYEMPDKLAGLHRVAARWLAGAGHLDDAVRHAAHVDWQLAASLVVDGLGVGRLMRRPGRSRLAEVFSTMPTASGGPDGEVVLAAYAIGRGDPATAEVHLARATRADASSPPDRAALRLATALVRAELALAQGDADLVAAEASEVHDLLREIDHRTGQGPGEVRALVLALDGVAQICAGNHGGAEQALRAALSHSPEASPVLRLALMGHLALVLALEGRLDEASSWAAAAEELADEDDLATCPQIAACRIATAWVAYERHDRATARQQLDLVQDAGSDSRVAALSAALRTRLLRPGSDGDRTVHALRSERSALERASRSKAVPGWLAEELAFAESRALLARGDRDDAVTVLGATEGPKRDVAVAEARLTFDDPDGALRVLDGLFRDGDCLPVPVMVDARLVEARAAAARDDPRHALRAVRTALDLGRPERLRRPFADARPWLRPLALRDPDLARGNDWLGEPWTNRAELKVEHSESAEAAATAPMVEDLSGREREVLQHLAQMMSTQEMAEALFISPNTVKTHLKSIYRKLGATRRSQAVRRARHLHLL